MKGSRLCLLLVALCLAGAAIVPAANARGLLDPGFGENGVVELPPISMRGETQVYPVANADGSVYVGEDRQTCPRPGCGSKSFVRRYGPDGQPDAKFGSLYLGPTSYATGTVTNFELDGRGGLLVSRSEKGRGVVLRRLLLPRGTLDRGFGNDGSLFLPCRCQSGGVSLTPDGRLLVSGSNEIRHGGRYRGSVWIYRRVGQDGRPDRSFGGDGEVRLRMPGFEAPDLDFLPGGGLVLAGEGCCNGYIALQPYLMRLSSRGRLDRRYGEAAKRSFKGLYETRPEDVGWEGFQLIVRAGGKVEIYGAAYEHGVAMRLRADGRRDPSFAGDGVRLLKMELSDAAPDGAGGTFVVGYQRAEGVIHLLPNGELDRSFGFVRTPGVGSEYGAWIQPFGPGAVLVFGDNYYLCRSDCTGYPAMARVVWR